MAKRKELTGRVFDKLTVKGFSHMVGKMSYWHVDCECGNKMVVNRRSLIEGRNKCGCTQVVHGMTNSPEYRSWKAAKHRVNDPNNHWYFGKVSMCDRWLEPKGIGFQNFYSDMGPRPQGTTLDRINRKGDYCPDNCRWATDPTQARNKDWCVLTFDQVEPIIEMYDSGIEMKEIAIEYGVSKGTISSLLREETWM